MNATIKRALHVAVLVLMVLSAGCSRADLTGVESGLCTHALRDDGQGSFEQFCLEDLPNDEVIEEGDGSD